jgi:hypothetical protein
MFTGQGVVPDLYGWCTQIAEPASKELPCARRARHREPSARQRFIKAEFDIRCGTGECLRGVAVHELARPIDHALLALE